MNKILSLILLSLFISGCVEETDYQVKIRFDREIIYKCTELGGIPSSGTPPICFQPDSIIPIKLDSLHIKIVEKN